MADAEKKNPELEQNKKEREMPLIGKVVVIGLFGGIFWSLLSYFTYVFHFTELSPNLVLKPWILGDWKNRVLGQFIGVVVIGIISIGVALLYYAFLKKFQSIWVGAGFGIVLWLIVFYVFNPIFPDIKTVAELKRDTVITTICFYILYGVFIGYSISFEHNEMRDERQAEAVSTNE
ncbi:YqhR family membrane protein [Bacillus sp. REN16]|nr:YqhR family membrane protein [Bacillus sp. REN16]MCC3358686.1 YqhR family membrane protein [Bacillus sp. REN16]